MINKSESSDKKTELLAQSENNIEKYSHDSLSSYLKQINKFPILTSQEEYEYAQRFKKNGDKEAAKILVQSHLRLVFKIATKFKGYGLPVTDLISEGNIGLIKAVKKFDPDKGFRFSTYAMWWIRANIQEYILRSWSLVKIGTTLAQKKLFFNLKKIKKRLKLGSSDEEFLSDEQVKRISNDLNVSEKEVKEMDSRLSNSDFSINTKIGDDDSTEMSDIIIDQNDNQEKIAIDSQEKEQREQMLKEAFAVLNDREKDILIKRQMSEVSMTLDELSKIYNISRERIRQVEASAIEKIKKEVARLQQNKI